MLNEEETMWCHGQKFGTPTHCGFGRSVIGNELLPHSTFVVRADCIRLIYHIRHNNDAVQHVLASRKWCGRARYRIAWMHDGKRFEPLYSIH